MCTCPDHRLFLASLFNTTFSFCLIQDPCSSDVVSLLLLLWCKHGADAVMSCWGMCSVVTDAEAVRASLSLTAGYCYSLDKEVCVWLCVSVIVWVPHVSEELPCFMHKKVCVCLCDNERISQYQPVSTGRCESPLSWSADQTTRDERLHTHIKTVSHTSVTVGTFIMCNFGPFIWTWAHIIRLIPLKLSPQCFNVSL